MTHLEPVLAFLGAPFPLFMAGVLIGSAAWTKVCKCDRLASSK